MERTLLDNLIYLDNAATSWPKPDNVYKFMIDFYRGCGVNPGRSGFDKAIEAGNLVEELRKRLTRFFGGDESAMYSSTKTAANRNAVGTIIASLCVFIPAILAETVCDVQRY